FFFSSRRRHTSFSRDWSSDVCSSDLGVAAVPTIADDQYHSAVAQHAARPFLVERLKRLSDTGPAGPVLHLARDTLHRLVDRAVADRKSVVEGKREGCGGSECLAWNNS